MEDFYVTFGVQYTKHPGATKHPLRMQSKGWAVIVADRLAEAQDIAHDIFGIRYAFVYDKANFIDDGTAARWHPDGEILRITNDKRLIYTNDEEKLQ